MSDLVTSNPVDVFMAATDKAGMRGAMDLGDAATKGVGSTAETVAAGNHGHAGLSVQDAATASVRALGTGPTNACAGNDTRLSDARTPTTHAASHKSGGADAIKLDELATPSDNTTLDATDALHGLMSKADKAKLNGVQEGAQKTDATNIAAAVGGADAKETPVDADFLALFDSADSNALKKLTWEKFRTAMATHFASRATAITSGLTITTGRLLGRTTAEDGALEEITVGSGLSFAGGVLSALGGGGGGGGENLLGTYPFANDAYSDITGMTGHEKYILRLKDVICSANGYPLCAYTSSDNGSSFNSEAASHYSGKGSQGTYLEERGFKTRWEWSYTTRDVEGRGLSGDIHIFNAGDSGLPTTFGGILMEWDYTTSPEDMRAWVIYGSTTAAGITNALRVFFGNSNLLKGGSMKLIGITPVSP